jgi:hypothetical protein
VVPTRLRGKAKVSSVQIERCTIRGNGSDVPAFGIEVSNAEGFEITTTDCVDNMGIGIGVIDSQAVAVRSCVIRGTVKTVNKSDAGVMWAGSTGAMPAPGAHPPARC